MCQWLRCVSKSYRVHSIVNELRILRAESKAREEGMQTVGTELGFNKINHKILCQTQTQAVNGCNAACLSDDIIVKSSAL